VSCGHNSIHANFTSPIFQNARLHLQDMQTTEDIECEVALQRGDAHGIHSMTKILERRGGSFLLKRTVMQD
jgi:hypothetical protein